MRPGNIFFHRFHARGTVNLGSLIPGLSLPDTMDYNHRRKLPLLDVSVRGGDGCVLPCDTDMTPSRKSPSPSTAPAGADPQNSGTETRAQRIERIRREIQAGTYDTPEKLEAAIDRMMGVLAD